MPRISTGLLICALVLSCSSLSAQFVNDLERASDNHSSSDCGNSSSGSSSSSSSSSSDDNSSSSTWDYSSDSDDSDYRYSSGGSGGDFSELPPMFCAQTVTAPFVAIYNAQHFMLQRKDQVRRMVSLEAQVPVGIGMDGYFTFFPQVRGNWGLFSSGFRYTNLTEPALEGRRSWITYDIEALQFNVIQSKLLRWRIGTGLTIQDYQGLPFHEYISGLDFHFFDERLVVANEGRVSTDYCDCGPADTQRMEYNGSFRLRVAESKHFSLYSSYNFLYQNYYGTVKVWTAGAGLHMLLH